MPETKKPFKPRVSDEAVGARTGKVWREWLEALDAAGARKMTRKEIITWLGKHHRNVTPWWQQMITVTYELARGRREEHQQPSGYEISISRTVPVTVGTLYDAWQDGKSRDKWLPKAMLTVRKATKNKSMRITWEKDGTNLDVNFYKKGPQKTQVAVQHSRLPDKKAADRMKAYWGKALDRLKAILSD
jgi:uncharacterized protein YndB with AHSA1/START domain